MNKMNRKERYEFYLNKIAVHDRDILRYLYSITGDTELAKDLKQTTLEKAWKKLDHLKDPEKAKSWLTSIAKNEAKQFFRKNQSKGKLKDEKEPLYDEVVTLKDNEPLAEDMLIKACEFDMLKEALERLDPKYQRLIRMYYLQKIPAKEIADILGINYSTTRVNLARGLHKLRDIYLSIEKGKKK